jgi:hypothetical protein
MDAKPYASRCRDRAVRNFQDDIYLAGGDQLLLEVEEDDDGYAARFDIGLQIV